MRTICSTMSALPSMSGRQFGTIAVAVLRPRSRAAQGCASPSASGMSSAGQPLHLAVGETELAAAAWRDRRRRRSSRARRRRNRSRDGSRARAPGMQKAGIDAALEAVARVGDDAELAAGLRRCWRRPTARFRSARRVVFSSQPECSPPMMPAIDSTPLSSAMTTMAGVERIGAAVEREHALAGPGAPHRQIALDLGGVEHMQRAAAIEGQVVGDVDQRVDRPQPDGAQPLLHPFGRGAVADAAHEAQREGGAELAVGLGRSRASPATGQSKRAADRLDRPASSACRGPPPRDRARCPRRPSHPGRLGVRLMSMTAIVEAGIGRIGRADRRVLGQVDDAVVIFGQFEFGGRAQHAVRLDAADDALRRA